jgi:hypothetical protein
VSDLRELSAWSPASPAEGGLIDRAPATLATEAVGAGAAVDTGSGVPPSTGKFAGSGGGPPVAADLATTLIDVVSVEVSTSPS